MSVRLSHLIAPAFHPAHLALKEQRFSEYWLKGGRGSGKSSFVSIEIILGMMRAPEAHALIYRKVAATLRESVYEQMIWAIRQLGLEEEFRCRLAPLEIENLRTGQRILFRGADDPGKSKSIKLAKGYFGYLWFEELDEFSGVRDIRTIRASALRGGPGAVTFCTYNPPQSARSWVNAEAIIPHPGRMVHASSYLDMPRDWLGSAFIEDAEFLRQSDERAWRHMYLGEITGSGAQVFDNLSLRKLSADELSAGRTWCGLDFGFAADPDAFIRVGYDPARRKLWVLDEFYSVRTPVDALAEAVREKSLGGVVRCDSADPRMISQLRQHGVNAIAVKKGPGSVAAGMRWLQELNEIAVDPEKCPRAAKELSLYEYPPAPDGGFLSEYPDRDNHLIDALRYAMEPHSGKRAAKTFKGLY